MSVNVKHPVESFQSFFYLKSWTCCISEDCCFELVWSGDTQVSTKLNFVWAKPQRESWWKINPSLKLKVDPLKISDCGLSQNVTISSTKRAQQRNVHILLWKYNLIVTRASKNHVIHSVGIVVDRWEEIQSRGYVYQPSGSFISPNSALLTATLNSALSLRLPPPPPESNVVRH